MLCLTLCICSRGIAQQIKTADTPLTEVLKQIEQKTGYRFFWLEADVKDIRVNVNTDANNLHTLMKALLEKTDLEYTTYSDKYVFLVKDRKMVDNLPAFVGWTEGKSTDSESELLQTDNLKATSENRIYVVGKPENKSNRRTVELSGVITSFKTGEPVMGVNMVIRKPVWSAAVSDIDGKFVLKVPVGEVDIEMTGIGINDTHRRLMVYENGKLDIELEDKIQTLDEVTITANKRENVKDVQMGMESLVIEELKTIPTAFGELDVIKVVQTLPGVKTMGEASSGFNVRGGSTDQNLILWNEGIIYNPTHLFGFFSAFNGSIVKDMELYKGSIPAKYGGRISSVLDINSRRGNKEKYQGEVSLGLLTSSLALEGPIKKGKTSLLLAGRTTYSDWILNMLPENSGYKNGKAGFYDSNLLLSHQFSPKNNLYIS